MSRPTVLSLLLQIVLSDLGTDMELTRLPIGTYGLPRPQEIDVSDHIKE